MEYAGDLPSTHLDKTLLIITGPIISVGKTGDTFSSSVPDRVQFNCIENISKLVESSPFPTSILVTWDSETPHPDVKTLRFSDADVPEGKGWAANKYRQSYLIAKGARWALDHDFEYVVRVRTDQFIDLTMLTINEFRAAASGKLVVQPPLVGGPWLPDFFFLGRSEILADFFASHLATAELSSDTHEDLFRRWAVINRAPKHSLFPFLGQPFSRAQIESSRYLWANHLHTLEVGALDGFTWRGRPLNVDFTNHDPAWDPPLYGGRQWMRHVPDGLVTLVWTNWYHATSTHRPLFEDNAMRRLRRKIAFGANKVLEIAVLKIVSSRDRFRPRRRTSLAR